MKFTLLSARKAGRLTKKDLGQEPFRWLVYDRPGGTVLAVSPTFHLPCGRGDIFEVRIGEFAVVDP